MASKPSTGSFEDVLISRDLHGRLHEFVSSLHKKLIETASRRAVARCPEQDEVFLLADDVVTAAGTVMPASVAELKQALGATASPHVRPHVRKRAS